MSQSTVTEKRTVITSSSGGSGYDSIEDIPYKASFGSRSSNIMSRSSLPLRSSTGGTQVTRVVEYGYGSHLGGGMGPGGYSTVSNSGVTSVKSTREKEKKDLQDLNERFASYIEKVRFLEAQNRKLGSELDELRSKWGKETSQIKQMYEAELAEARRLIDDLSKDKAALEIKTSSLQEQFGDMQRQLDEAKKYRQTDRETINKLNQQLADCESEINMLRRSIESLETERSRDKATINRQQQEIDKLRIDLNNETLAHLDAENRRQTLEEEMEFMKKVHEQELKELAALAYRDTTAENREFWKSELGQAIRDIQQEYDAKVEQLRGDMEGFYNLKIQEYRTGATKQNMEVTHIREENKKLSKQMSDLRGKLADLEARNAQLEKQYQDALRELETKETDHMMETTQLKEEIIKLRAEMEGILTELQTLMDAKLSLELEIAAYRKLLEGEENRVDWRSRASLIMYRDAFKPKSDRTEQESTREKEPEKLIEAKTDKTVSRQPDQREPSPDTDAASSITMSDNETSQKGDEGDLELEEQFSGDKGLDAQGARSETVADLDNSGVGTVIGSVESIKSPVHEHVVKVKEEVQKLETQKAVLDETDSKENGQINVSESVLVNSENLAKDDSDIKIESEKSVTSHVDEIMELKTSAVVESGIDKDAETETSSLIATYDKANSSEDESKSEVKDKEIEKEEPMSSKQIDEAKKIDLDQKTMDDKINIFENEQENQMDRLETVEKQVISESNLEAFVETITPTKDETNSKVSNILDSKSESQIFSSDIDERQVVSESKQDALPKKITPTDEGSDKDQMVTDKKTDEVKYQDKIPIADTHIDEKQNVAESKQDKLPEEIIQREDVFDKSITDEKADVFEKYEESQKTSSDISEKPVIEESEQDIIQEKLESSKDDVEQKVDNETVKDDTDSKSESQLKPSPDDQINAPSHTDFKAVVDDKTPETDTFSKVPDLRNEKVEENIEDELNNDSVHVDGCIDRNGEKSVTALHETSSAETDMKEIANSFSAEKTSADIIQVSGLDVSEISPKQVENTEKSKISESSVASVEETCIKNEMIPNEADAQQQKYDSNTQSTKSENAEVSDTKQFEHAENDEEKSDSLINGEFDHDLRLIEDKSEDQILKESSTNNIQTDIKQVEKEKQISKPLKTELEKLEIDSILDSEKTITESGAIDNEKETTLQSKDNQIEIQSAKSLTINTTDINTSEEAEKSVSLEESKVDTYNDVREKISESSPKEKGEHMKEKECISSIETPETDIVGQKKRSELSASSSSVTTLLADGEINVSSISQKNESIIESVKSETIIESISSKSEISETVSEQAKSEKTEVVTEKNIVSKKNVVSDKTETQIELTEKTEDKILESVVQSKIIEKSLDSTRLEMSPTKELPESFPDVQKEESQHLSTTLEVKKTVISGNESPESDKSPTAKALPESHSSEPIEDDKTPDEEEPNVSSNLKLSSDPSDVKEKGLDHTNIEESMTVSNTADVQHVESTSKNEALISEIKSEHQNVEDQSGDYNNIVDESEKDIIKKTVHSKESDIMTQSFISENGLLANGDIKEDDYKTSLPEGTFDENEKSMSKEEEAKTKDETVDYGGVPDKPSEQVEKHDTVLQEKIESLLLNGQGMLKLVGLKKVVEQVVNTQSHGGEMLSEFVSGYESRGDEQSTLQRPENVIEATSTTSKPDSQVSMKMMRGEVSAKTTYQRTSTGPIAICEVEPNAKYITLENTSSGPNRKDVNLDGWRLRRIVDGDKEYCYNFRNFTLKPGKKVKIMARGSASEAGLNDLVFRDENTWGVGQQVTTSLCNEKDEEKASHIQRTNYN